MDFPTYLLRMNFMAKDEFSRIAVGVVKAADGRWVNGFLMPTIDDVGIDSIDRIRPFPFGDVLEASGDILGNVLGRSGCRSFESLIENWQLWHVENIQPISDYALSPSSPRPFGKRLYDNCREKRMCGIVFAQRLTHHRDHVVIPEGTSAFWVGLAVLSICPEVRIITSNGALVREVLENPILRKRAKSIHVIGGDLDIELGGTGRGFVGFAAQTAFDHAVKNEPGATVVVSSVNGLLADAGPFAPCPITAFTRHALIRQALDSDVRCVGFVADHTKMRSKDVGSYGEPIFVDQSSWREIVAKKTERLSFVVAPPAELIASEESVIRPCLRTIFGKGFSLPTVDYLRSAAALDGIWRDTESHFHETGLKARAA